jgi:hypothetical protein
VPTPFKRTEFPNTLTRLKWQAKIRVGIDTSGVLGLSPDLVQDGVVATSQLLTNNLKDVGAVESLEVLQTRTMLDRFGFGPNPLQSFEIVPTGITVVLKLSKAVLFNLPEAEALFNFYPSNLLYQQLPFILQVDSPSLQGPAGTPASPRLTHFFLGCWFTDTSVRYSTTERDDQRLIQSASVKCARIVTQDGSNASSFTASALSSTVGGVLALGNNQAILDDLELT